MLRSDKLAEHVLPAVGASIASWQQFRKPIAQRHSPIQEALMTAMDRRSVSCELNSAAAPFVPRKVMTCFQSVRKHLVRRGCACRIPSGVRWTDDARGPSLVGATRSPAPTLLRATCLVTVGARRSRCARC